MGKQKCYYTDQNGKKYEVSILQKKRIALCKKLSSKMSLLLMHSGGLKFYLEDKNHNRVGFKSDKSLNGIQRFLLTHDFVDGTFVKDEKRKNK